MSALRRLLRRLSRGEGNCILNGHPLRIEPGREVRGHVYGPVLVCERCEEMTALAAEPPADHPDSMTVELTEAEEEMLAALDAELFPEDAEC